MAPSDFEDTYIEGGLLTYKPTVLIVLFMVGICHVAVATISMDAPGTCRFNYEDDPLPACLITVSGKNYIAPQYRSRLDYSGKAGSPIAAQYGLAVVFLPGGFGYVNRQGRVVIARVVAFDNGPSDFIYGIVRVNDGPKMNYVTPAGERVFPNSFDWVSPFWHGRAYACNGCREICRLEPREWGNCEDIDISYVGGQWLRVYPKGSIVPIQRKRMFQWMFDPGLTEKPTYHRPEMSSTPSSHSSQ